MLLRTYDIIALAYATISITGRHSLPDGGCAGVMEGIRVETESRLRIEGLTRRRDGRPVEVSAGRADRIGC
jgi:hypothetical protein